jgi:hypothetical protein
LGLNTGARFLWLANNAGTSIVMYDVGTSSTTKVVKPPSSAITSVTDVLQYSSGTPTSQNSGITLTAGSDANVSGRIYYYWAVN